MNREQKKNFQSWLDERYQIAVNTEQTRYNNTKQYFTESNPDYIYYNGACESLLFMGLDWRRNENGKHYIF